VRAQLSADQAQQRSLAGSARPHDGRHLAASDIDVDTVEDLARTAREVQISHFDQNVGFIGSYHSVPRDAPHLPWRPWQRPLQPPIPAVNRWSIGYAPGTSQTASLARAALPSGNASPMALLPGAPTAVPGYDDGSAIACPPSAILPPQSGRHALTAAATRRACARTRPDLARCCRKLGQKVKKEYRFDRPYLA